MNKDAPIFVAGHQGMVGSALVRRLEKAGYRHLITRCRDELNLERQDAVETFFRTTRPAYVFLAAAKVGGIWANQTFPAEFIYNNLAIQTHVLQSAHQYGVKQLVFLGSSCIYPRNCPQPMAEHHLLTGPLEATNRPYALAKIAGIEMCRAYNRQYGTRFLAVMPTNLYGPHDNFDLTTSHVLPALLRKFHVAKLALAGDLEGIGRDMRHFGSLPADFLTGLGLRQAGENQVAAASSLQQEAGVILWGSGTPYREFLHVDDMADACIYLMSQSADYPLADHLGDDDASPDDPQCIQPFYNVGTGQDLTIRELTKIIRRIVNYQGPIHWDASKPDGTPRKRLDTHAMSQLGWRPQIPLKEGIDQAYQWYCQQV